MRGLYSEGNLRFKIDWASFIFGINLPFLLCFPLYLRAIFQVQAPGGAYIWRGDLTEGFLRYRFGGLIFGGAYTWRVLFSEFYGILKVTFQSDAYVLKFRVFIICTFFPN